jgi:integrase
MHKKGPTYYLVLGSGAKRKWVNLGRNYFDALQEYKRHINDVPTEGTLAALAAHYVEQKWSSLSAATIESYEPALANVLAVFGDAPVEKITPGDVGRYMDLRPSKHSANREKAILSGMLQLAVRWGWCQTNVARAIDYHPCPKRRRVITRDDWASIHAAARSNVMTVFMDLSLATGLRVGDVLSLTWGSIRHDGLHVTQSKNNVSGCYRLSQDMRSILDRASNLHPQTNVHPGLHIIHTGKQSQYTYAGLRSMWNRTLERANLKYHIHDIRRTAITTAKQAGMRPQEFSLHKTETQAAAYVIETPMVEPNRIW